MSLFSNFLITSKTKLFSLLMVFFVVLLVIPQASYAQVKSEQYQPESLHELIAYLYGVLATLEAQLNAQQGDAYSYTGTTNQARASTLTPTDVDEEEATIRGEVEFGSAKYVYVYFEYGTRSTFGEETSRVRTSRTSDSKKFDATLEDLREDQKYYYRAVVELPNGDLLRGSTRTFVTDEDNNRSYYNGDYIELEDDEYRGNDAITIRVEAPSSLVLNQGWVGLYKEDDDNLSYFTYRYVNYRNQTLTFYAPYEEGEYEFRLFKDSGYTQIYTSDSFAVRN